LLLTGATFTSTSGNQIGLSFGGGFTPTSGTATYSAYSILPTINQTGGANGVTRGLYVNPTLTSAADFRAIETTSGSVIFNSGSVGIGTTSPSGKLDVVGTRVTARFLTTGDLSLIGTDQTAAAQTILTLSTGVGNATGPNIVLSKARGQSNDAITTGDALGTIQFQGANGTTSVESSRIQSIATGLFSLTSRPADLAISTTALNSTSPTERVRIFANGNLAIGTTTDNGYRLQASATGSNSGSLFVGGTNVASGGIATTMLISSSLSASANSDVLVGLDINPSFNTGAFTGVQPIALKLPNPGRIASVNNSYNVYVANTETTLNSPSPTGIIGFQLATGFVGRFMGTTGNLILQNGGTFTDAGYRLDVSGSTRVQGSAFIGPSEIRPFASSIAANPTGGNIAIIPNNVSNTLIDSTGAIFLRSSTVGITSNLFTLCSIQTVFSPTSGTGVNNNLVIHPIINQTGGANGITRGLYINPTLTSAADFRAIETTNGKVIFSGTGSVTISNVLTLTPQSPLPSGVATGSFAVSSSVPPKPYFYDGTTWNALY
jgi:hypothetical protein